MKRLVGALICALSLAGAGCAEKSVPCGPKEGSVVICKDGQPVDFSAEKVKPHKHENGNLYAPAVPLARALGVQIQVDAAAKKAVVNGKRIDVVTTETVKGIHLHEGAVFVPLKEFAAAAGLRLEMDDVKGTAHFHAAD